VNGSVLPKTQLCRLPVSSKVQTRSSRFINNYQCCAVILGLIVKRLSSLALISLFLLRSICAMFSINKFQLVLYHSLFAEIFDEIFNSFGSIYGGTERISPIYGDLDFFSTKVVFNMQLVLNTFYGNFCQKDNKNRLFGLKFAKVILISANGQLS
jgi:hypothetical protein